MNKQAIAEAVKDGIIHQLGVSESNYSEDGSLIEDMGADSLDMIELLMWLEEEIGFEIEDDDAEKMTTPRHAIDYIDNRLNA